MSMSLTLMTTLKPWKGTYLECVYVYECVCICVCLRVVDTGMCCVCVCVCVYVSFIQQYAVGRGWKRLAILQWEWVSAHTLYSTLNIHPTLH